MHRVVSTASSTFNVSGLTGVIAVGMTASGASTDVPAGTRVSSVPYDAGGNPTSVTLNNTITTANNGTITFSGPGGATITGRYGTLVLNADGKGGYTYTPNASGSGGTDVFTYKMQDLAGLTSTATLNIQVLAAATTLTTVADTKSITVGTASVSDNVITNTVGSAGNDSSTGGTESIITGATAQAALGTTQTISSGGYQDIAGQYGTPPLVFKRCLYLHSRHRCHHDGQAQCASGSGATLTDSFQYLATNATSAAKSAAPLTITITGVDDAPTLKLNAAGSGSTNYTAQFTPTYTVGASTVTARSCSVGELNGHPHRRCG